MRATLPSGTLPQSIISSSWKPAAACAAGVGRTSNVFGIRRDATSPGLSDATSERLRCASLSELPGVEPALMTSGSKAISATRHWCALRTSDSTDCSVPPNGPSLDGFSGNTACADWFTSRMQPKNDSTSTPEASCTSVRTFAGSVCVVMLTLAELTRSAAKQGMLKMLLFTRPSSGIFWPLRTPSEKVLYVVAVVIGEGDGERREHAEEDADSLRVVDQRAVAHARDREGEDRPFPSCRSGRARPLRCRSGARRRSGRRCSRC